eukprot:3760615-Rhodomonas_salina.3
MSGTDVAQNVVRYGMSGGYEGQGDGRATTSPGPILPYPGTGLRIAGSCSALSQYRTSYSVPSAALDA